MDVARRLKYFHGIDQQPSTSSRSAFAGGNDGQGAFCASHAMGMVRVVQSRKHQKTMLLQCCAGFLISWCPAVLNILVSCYPAYPAILRAHRRALGARGRERSYDAQMGVRPGRAPSPYSHPGRKQDGKFNYCGCYFSAPLWEEYKTDSDKTRWKCELDLERVKLAFPHEYQDALKRNPKLHLTPMPTCGMRYRPFRDGPAALIEMLVEDQWIAIASELLPEHVYDRFQQAQGEWYKVLHTSSAEDVKMKILEHATQPSVASLIVDNDLRVIGKFPLEKFYQEGNKALTQRDWVRYFIEVAALAETPGLKMLEKVCKKFLMRENCIQEVGQNPPEVLPCTLSSGSRD